MHRGSSNVAGGRTPPAETLPLSASPSFVSVVLEVTRAGAVARHAVSVPTGTPLRAVLRQAGLAPEGCAVFVAGRSWPLDRTLEADVVAAVVPTFSGG